jgi:hypothetical protein
MSIVKEIIKDNKFKKITVRGSSETERGLFLCGRCQYMCEGDEYDYCGLFREDLDHYFDLLTKEYGHLRDNYCLIFEKETYDYDKAYKTLIKIGCEEVDHECKVGVEQLPNLELNMTTPTELELS